jgi:hypothetical protein
MNIRRGLARIAHDQAENLTTLAILVQNGLERRRITRLVISGIEFASILPIIRFDFSSFYLVILEICNENLPSSYP